MSRNAATGLPENFWAAARAAQHRLLALDFDGTLAPFVVDPAAARPLPAARRALARIAESGTTDLAVLSGRPACDVARLLDGLPVPVAGEHGWELRYRDGARLAHPVAPGLVARLDEAERAAEALAPARIERKRTALVVHTRGLAPEAARAAVAAARRLLEPWTADGQFALRPIDGGLELRLCGRDKGTALGELAARTGNGTFVVAVGDDDTDEDAFRAARRRGGWGILVGDRPGSAARARLGSPEDVATFLAEWAERLGGAPIAGDPGSLGAAG